MENALLWWQAFQESLAASLTSIVQYLPSLGAALVVMLVGWIAARVLQALLLRSGRALNALLERLGRPVNSTRLRLSRRVLTLTGNFAFWVVILLFAAAAARVAGLEAFTGWLDRVVDYLPTLIAGVLIAIAGYLLSTLVRDVVGTALASTRAERIEYLALAAQAAVFVTALVIGLDQIGIDVTFLIILVAVLVGGCLLSVALAFGIGARDFVGNLIAASQVQRTLEPGDRARIGGIEGRVLEITSTAVVLLNEQGRLSIPAAIFQRETAAVLSGDTDE
jgi:small-conductance mechanosensitive channel